MQQRQQQAVDRAAQIPIDFGGDVLAFPFRNPQGEEWEGCLEEWVGNGTFYEHRLVEHPGDGRNYIAVGASGGGADLVIVRDDGVVCYLNDFDQRVSVVANSVDEFVALLRPL